MAGIGKKYTKLEWGQKTLNGINVTFKWNEAPSNPVHPRYTWGEVELIQHAAGDDYTQWTDFKKKKLIKLILKVHGNTITESKKREIKQYKIKVSDIKLAVKKISGVEIMTENIKF